MTAPFLMPAIAALAMIVAAAAGSAAWLAHADRDSARVTLWDYAGASTLIAIAAGMFTPSHHVIQFFGVAIVAP